MVWYLFTDQLERRKCRQFILLSGDGTKARIKVLFAIIANVNVVLIHIGNKIMEKALVICFLCLFGRNAMFIAYRVFCAQVTIFIHLDY